MTDYGHPLEFGVFITPSAADAEAVLALASLADEAGLDLVTFQDHPYQPAFLDTWTLLSVVAARTSRVRVAANVLNLPLRPPAVLARAVASLDILSGGRAELGIGAGAFWDGVAGMGGPRRGPGEAVDALEEAIDVIRALWDTDTRGGVRTDGPRYRLAGAKRGPAPAHDVGIWVGAYKPRMLDLVGRKADGWLPSLAYLAPGGLAEGNAAIDAAATRAGRDSAAIRRLLNIPADAAEPDELVRLAREDGVGTFIVTADDAAVIERLAREVAPAVRERVAAAREGAASTAPAPPAASAAPAPQASPDRPDPRELGVEPTADDGVRLAATAPWDEASRPVAPAPDGEVTYTRRGRLVAGHLIEVHDMLRTELAELRDVLAQVREGALSAGDARGALNEMALRQNDWTLGAFCSRYCGAVTRHHGLEDDAILPHLARSEPGLAPVIDRLVDEHVVIHEAILEVDAALVDHLEHPEAGFGRIQEAIDLLTDALVSHLAYEERELVGPLARNGFFAGQIRG
ncbi:MAG: LLM class flavin-dependent oxidoreductase [Thermoleophilia bacterium]